MKGLRRGGKPINHFRNPPDEGGAFPDDDDVCRRDQFLSSDDNDDVKVPSSL